MTRKEKTMHLCRMAKLFVLLSLILIVNGCSGGDSGYWWGGGGGTGASNTFGDTGGTATLNGVVVTVPTGAVYTGESVTVTVALEDAAPGTLPTDAVLCSKTVVVTKSTAYDLNEAATLTIPFTTAGLDPNDLPMVFYWDATAGQYVPVGVKGIDPVAKTVTFTTVHAGKYVALGMKGLAASLGFTSYSTARNATGSAAKTRAAAAPIVADSNFRSDVDGFFHPNFGAYDHPGGSCLGMANYAVFYYSSVKASNGNTGLYTMYKEGDLARWEDDLTARELISRAFLASSQQWGKMWMLKGYQLGQQVTGLLTITALKLTGHPFTYIIGDNEPDNMTWGHAIVVYKYDQSAGKFYFNDVNFPGEEVTVDWQPGANGRYIFSNYSKAAAYSPAPAVYGLEGFSTSAEINEYMMLYNGAKNGWTGANSKFNTITITSALDSANNNVLQADGSIKLPVSGTVKIQGTVTGGIQTANYIVYRINGGQQYAINVAGGAFNFTTPNIVNGDNTLQMVATDQWQNKWNAYAGFKELPIKIQGNVFFINAGFETSTFIPWLHETHTWQDSTPGSFTPEKSGIVAPGPDPIASSIQMVYKGNSAVRVNNSDNSYHISTVSQTATVPAVPNPQISFYWAAVLEDPQHLPSEQPYVDIVITEKNKVSGNVTTVYSKHFYSNDPSYPGWLSFDGGNWKAIPWQRVTRTFTQASVGNEVTVTVTGADCSLGGHGGYVYFDGDE